MCLTLACASCGANAPTLNHPPVLPPVPTTDANTPPSPDHSPPDGGHTTPSADATDAPIPDEAPAPPQLPLPGVAGLMETAIRAGKLPGAVVAVGTSDGLRYLRAFGQRALDPPEPMTEDTLFDLASLTKPLATAASVHLLVERGLVSLDAPAARYLPAFGAKGKRRVTVRQLLLHTSGLDRVNPLRDFAGGAEAGLARILGRKLAHLPGQRFEYSDLGYIVLGALVERVAGQPLDVFSEAAFYRPLAMADTKFRPPATDRARCAPTEERDDQPIRGVVDDPRCYRLGGVAGNAGLFSTARDVSRFAQMMLRGGEVDGQRVLQAQSVERWTKPQTAAQAQRTPGWDAQSDYAKGRGLNMSRKTYGHGGYTGTSLWLDPERDLFVLLLSNRVHVGPGGSIHPLASAIGDIAVAAVERERAPAEHVLTGIDVLEQQAHARLRGAKVAVLTNHAARTRKGQRTLDVLLRAPKVRVISVWTPEHGLSARREGHVGSSRLGKNGPPVFSLFGKQRDPTYGMLRGIDTIVIDLQDVGVRFYTYMSTILRVLRSAADNGLRVVLLDRPNPLGGTVVAGPVREAAYESFVNYHPLPVVHGMTAGELAMLLNAEREVGARLEVVQTRGWRREMRFTDTGLTWRNPSPNLRSETQVTLYPALGLLEGTNLAVGRGTPTPFEVLGAPFIDGAALAADLSRRDLPGVRFASVSFVPRSSRHARKRCYGVRLSLTDARAFQPVRTAFAIAEALLKLAPEQWDRDRLPKGIAHAQAVQGLETGADFEALQATWLPGLRDFETIRRKYLLYP